MIPQPRPDARPGNALTVDVEDWFQVENYKSAIPRTDWDGLERRVVRNTDRLLESFAVFGVRATFFVLGWVAHRHPDLIRRIVAGGHELASHGYGHARVAVLAPLAFRKDVQAARRRLEDVGGCPVVGYRAPTFSMSPETTPWAYEILAECGYRYSSSVFPGRHAGAGSAELAPYAEPRSGLVEIPMTALRAGLLGGRMLPVSGGGWFRLMPYPLFAALLRQVHKDGRRGNFYLHPWEIDPDQPRPAGVKPLPARKHRLGLASTEARLFRLLREFRFDRMDQVFVAEIAAARPRPGAAHAATDAVPLSRAA